MGLRRNACYNALQKLSCENTLQPREGDLQ